MRVRRNFLAVALFAVLANAPKDIDFELVNQTSYDVSRVWLAKHESGRWGQNLLRQPIKAGMTGRITAPNKSDWQLWDLRLEYTKKNWELFTEGFELMKIGRITMSVENGRWKAHYEPGKIEP